MKYAVVVSFIKGGQHRAAFDVPDDKLLGLNAQEVGLIVDQYARKRLMDTIFYHIEKAEEDNSE